MTDKRFKSQIDECGVYYYICEDEEILAEGFYKDDAEDIAKRLNEQHETIQQVKKVLQEEYSERVKELDHWAEKEDWNSYGATKLEYGTVLRLAKKLGIELK